MNDGLFLLLALILGLAVSLIAAWFFWGRPLHDARAEANQKSHDLGKAFAEVAAFQSIAEELRPKAERAQELFSELSQARTLLDERERAHQQTLTEREQSFQQVLESKEKNFLETLAERERSYRQTLAAREQSFKEATEERNRLHETQLAHLRDEFQRLANEALEKAQNRFSEQAAETLKYHRTETEKGLVESKSAIEKLVQPMQETLGRYEQELKVIEAKREQAYGSLGEQLAALGRSEALVREEAGKIVAALRGSARTSGAWGEGQLRRVLELAGLAEGIDFDLQATATNEDGRQKRPDAILKMPGGRELIIDSKCSVEDHAAAMEAITDQERNEALARHATRIRAHVRNLASKAYWDEFGAAADFVLLFIPGENFLVSALEEDRDLHLWALDQRVLLVGPTMLLAVARVVAMVGRQEKMAEEARQIGKLGAELYERLVKMTEHINKVGRNLDEASKSWNGLMGSIERRVLVTARRLGELGVNQKGGEIAEPRLSEAGIRELKDGHQPVKLTQAASIEAPKG